MRQANCNLYMTLVVKFFSTNIKQHKVHSIIGNGMMHIPAIGFKFKQTFKMQ